jgi:hypothetical protein
MRSFRLFFAFGTAFALATPSAHALETRTYVVSWFSQGVSNQDGDCKDGLNPDFRKQDEINLILLGKTPAEAKAIIAKSVTDEGDLSTMMGNRGRIDGHPVNAYANPAAVADPKLHSVTGKIAYGFNLDGKGADDPNAFVDPDTGEKGVDNQAFRALGCSPAYRGTKDSPGAYWAYVHVAARDTSPAWLISVSGEDLSKDGPVTITFDRALEHATTNPDGKTRPYMTFRVDPDPHSHNEYRGQIKNRVLTITEPGPFFMTYSLMYTPYIQLSHTHLRMNMSRDGELDGFIGGYTPWRDVYFGIAFAGRSAETSVSGETPGLYYVLKRLADANPDPKTGENRDISISYRMTAVPAFLVHLEGNSSQGASR